MECNGHSQIVNWKFTIAIRELTLPKRVFAIKQNLRLIIILIKLLTNFELWIHWWLIMSLSMPFSRSAICQIGINWKIIAILANKLRNQVLTNPRLIIDVFSKFLLTFDLQLFKCCFFLLRTVQTGQFTWVFGEWQTVTETVLIEKQSD